MSKLTFQQRGNQNTRIPVGQRRATGGKALEDNRAAFAAKQLKQDQTAQLTKEEDELLKGKSGTKQLAKKDEEEIGQAKFSDRGPPVQREQQPAKPNNTGMPDKLKNGIESLSGLSMDNVKVHYNSAKPQQLNALAYAQGTDIHVGPGQEKHLPHEAWHVVQQAQGRVRPTMQMKEGVPVNDDAGLEREADVMGEKSLHTLKGIPEVKLAPKILSTLTMQMVLRNPADAEREAELIQQYHTEEELGANCDLNTPQGNRNAIGHYNNAIRLRLRVNSLHIAPDQGHLNAVSHLRILIVGCLSRLRALASKEQSKNDKKFNKPPDKDDDKGGGTTSIGTGSQASWLTGKPAWISHKT